MCAGSHLMSRDLIFAQSGPDLKYPNNSAHKINETPNETAGPVATLLATAISSMDFL